MSTGLKRIKERIHKSRKAAGLTQKDLADQMGISQAAYSYFENGDKPLPLRRLDMIAEILGVCFDDLVNLPKTEDIIEGQPHVLESIDQRLASIASSLERIVVLLEGK